MKTDTRLDDEDLKRIFTQYQAHRLEEVFDNQCLRGMNEFMVGVFKSRAWKDAKRFETRNQFIGQIKNIQVEPDDHRRLFRALAESGSAHGVIAYLHMIGHRNRVLLSDRSALLTTDELTLIVKDKGREIGSAIHFLARAAAPSNMDTLPMLPKLMVKEMGSQRDFKYRERFMEGLQSLVVSYGLKNLGMGKHDRDHKLWIDSFYRTNDHQTLSLSTSIIAAQISAKRLTPEEVINESQCFADKVRLVKNLGFKVSDFGAIAMISSHKTKQPSFRLESHLQI